LANYISFESLQSLVLILVIYGEIFVKINDRGAVIYQFAIILFSYSRPLFWNGDEHEKSWKNGRICFQFVLSLFSCQEFKR